MSYFTVPLQRHYRSTPSEEYYNIVELSERVRFLSLLRRNSRFGKIRLDNVIIVVNYNMEGYYDMVNSVNHTEPNH